MTRHFRASAIGTNDATASHTGGFFHAVVGANGEVHTANAIVVAAEFVKNTALTHRAMIFCSHTQPFVELVAVDHAHKATFDRDVHFLVFGRDHASRPCFGHQELIGDREVFDQTRRNRAAAGLDAPLPVEQQHMAAQFGQVIGCGGASWPATNHHHVISQVLHESAPE